MKSEIPSLARALGITDSQLQRLQLKYRREHGEEADEKLCAWLKAAHQEVRGRRWLLSRHPSSSVVDEHGERHYGYTESPSEAMKEGEEGVPPYEIEHYRLSRQAQVRFAEEKERDVGNFLGACQEIRDAVDKMDPEIKRSISRDLWVLKGRIDRLEQKLRRRAAA